MSIIQVWNIGSFSLLKFYISAICIVDHSESVNCTKYLHCVSFFYFFICWPEVLYLHHGCWLCIQHILTLVFSVGILTTFSLGMMDVFSMLILASFLVVIQSHFHHQWSYAKKWLRLWVELKGTSWLTSSLWCFYFFSCLLDGVEFMTWNPYHTGCNISIQECKGLITFISSAASTIPGSNPTVVKHTTLFANLVT